MSVSELQWCTEYGDALEIAVADLAWQRQLGEESLSFGDEGIGALDGVAALRARVLDGYCEAAAPKPPLPVPPSPARPKLLEFADQPKPPAESAQPEPPDQPVSPSVTIQSASPSSVSQNVVPLRPESESDR